MHDVLIIGGGVIGLSLAWELAKHGRSVHVINQSEPGREASWAGAGILPAASSASSTHPYEQLRGLACELHPRWAAELQAVTGIDTGFRRCGGLLLARTLGEAAALAAWADMTRDEGIEIEQISAANLKELEPGIAATRVTSAFLMKDEAQLRNPHHLQALLRACENLGVTVISDAACTELELRGNELSLVKTSAGPISAGQYCFTAGAWTGQLLKPLDLSIDVLPVRGQMVLFQCQQPPITRIVNEGSRYLVPREDGRVLAGSTEEEVGFDKRTTDEAIADLVGFARGVVPALADAKVEKTWAGLRPGSFDGLPYMGQLPGLKNAFIAAGHFRSGLFLSTATSVVMSQLMRGEKPEIDLAPFRVGR